MAASTFLTRLAILAASVLCLIRTEVLGQSAAPQTPGARPEMTESCPGLVASERPQILPAAFRPTAPAPNGAGASKAGHSTFLTEAPNLGRVAPDFNDYVRPPVLPDIVSMNHAHSTHFTDRPDPDIKFVLRGWRPDGKPANHDMTYSDVHGRRVSTNIRDRNGRTQRTGQPMLHFE